MSSLIESLTVGSIVLFAIVFLWRLKRRKTNHCGGGCDCTKPSQPTRIKPVTPAAERP